jgi:hypothetical protein
MSTTDEVVVPELLPCPFCGSSAGDVKLSRGHGYIIGCGMCPAQQFALTREEAVRLWNQRATPHAALISREEAVRIVQEFDNWTWCQCSECKSDASSHAAALPSSLERIAEELANLPTVQPTSNVKPDSLLPCGHPSHIRANSGYHYCKQYPDGITVSEAVSDSDAGPRSDE